MTELKYSVTESTEGDEAKAIEAGLIAYNDSQVEKSRQKHFVISARNERGEIVGGIKAYTLRGWLYIHQLWVSEGARGSGLGSKLLRQAEAEAQERRCVGAYLNTYSFQAHGFYQKHGYEIFGELDDFPAGHKNLFMRKRLRA